MPSPWEHTRPRGFMCQTPTDIPKRGSQPGSAVDQRAPLEMRGQQKVPKLLSSCPNQRCPHLSESAAQRGLNAACTVQRGLNAACTVQRGLNAACAVLTFFRRVWWGKVLYDRYVIRKLSVFPSLFSVLQFCHFKCSVFLLLKIMNTSYFYVKHFSMFL